MRKEQTTEQHQLREQLPLNVRSSTEASHKTRGELLVTVGFDVDQLKNAHDLLQPHLNVCRKENKHSSNNVPDNHDKVKKRVKQNSVRDVMRPSFLLMHSCKNGCDSPHYTDQDQTKIRDTEI